MKKAIIYGASGLVGSYILETLLNTDNYEQVVIVVRKDPGIQHPKLKVVISDFHSVAESVRGIQTDEVYIALGTTQKKTPDRKDYYQIDHDYPVLAARLAKENGAKTVLLVSSIGADANSGVFYTRTKGETERDIIRLNFDQTYIFRPSMILGDRLEKRPLEKVLQGLWKIINPLFIGKLNKYRGLEARNIAKAMVNAANHPGHIIKIFYWKEMTACLLSV